jgi:hypothetical protein
MRNSPCPSNIPHILLATGARLSVIIRAFRELFAYAYKWRREEQKRTQQARVLHTS